jgi:hypothetical protein
MGEQKIKIRTRQPSPFSVLPVKERGPGPLAVVSDILGALNNYIIK